MKVSVNSQIVTTKRTTVVFTSDEMKNVALLTAKSKVGSTDTITGTTAEVGDDGSITVVVDETITTSANDSAENDLKAETTPVIAEVADDAAKPKVVVAATLAEPIAAAPILPASPATSIVPVSPTAPVPAFSLRQG